MEPSHFWTGSRLVQLGKQWGSVEHTRIVALVRHAPVASAVSPGRSGVTTQSNMGVHGVAALLLVGTSATTMHSTPRWCAKREIPHILTAAVDGWTQAAAHAPPFRANNHSQRYAPLCVNVSLA